MYKQLFPHNAGSQTSSAVGIVGTKSVVFLAPECSLFYLPLHQANINLHQTVPAAGLVRCLISPRNSHIAARWTYGPHSNCYRSSRAHVPYRTIVSLIIARLPFLMLVDAYVQSLNQSISTHSTQLLQNAQETVLFVPLLNAEVVPVRPTCDKLSTRFLC